MLRVTGESNKPKVRSFIGADLRNTEDVKTRPRPMLSEAQKAQLRQEMVARGVYGPYQGPQHKLAMMTAMLHSGLSNAREEVEALCAPVSYEELKQISGHLDALQAQGQVLMAEAMLQQAMGGGGQQGAEAPAGTRPQIPQMGAGAAGAPMR